MTHKNNHQLYVIGYNEDNELGMAEADNIKVYNTLMKCDGKTLEIDIKEIIPGYGYSIIIDRNDNLFKTGNSQWPNIDNKFLKQNNIKIRRICITYQYYNWRSVRCNGRPSESNETNNLISIDRYC